MKGRNHIYENANFRYISWFKIKSYAPHYFQKNDKILRKIDWTIIFYTFVLVLWWGGGTWKISQNLNWLKCIRHAQYVRNVYAIVRSNRTTIILQLKNQ